MIPEKPHPPSHRPPAHKPEDRFGNEQIDTFTDDLGLQGVIQDGTKVAARTVGKNSVKMQRVAGVAAGESEVIKDVVRVSVKAAAESAERLGPRYGALVARVAQATGESSGTLAKVVGVGGAAISIPFAAYDVAKAYKEKDPVKKNGAWANATLTVGGAALGVGALVATGAAVPLLATSMVMGAFQLVDAYGFHGKGTDWIGEQAVKPVREALGFESSKH